MESSFLPLPQCGSRYVEQRVLATATAATAIARNSNSPATRRQKKDFKEDSIGEVEAQLPSPPTVPPYHSMEEYRKDHS